ncbi:hypothetical protein SAMN06295905_2965 [Devosia lucknowensis]|uniref:Uncharacterized protein n=1 Tax=Devosia lucknowensis TaxID=1096929 RepID=A0A1Y6G6G2_9HYPH|nr:hypothetical protein SAMN06295905_2965 [Devosia lucknowensis]
MVSGTSKSLTRLRLSPAERTLTFPALPSPCRDGGAFCSTTSI